MTGQTVQVIRIDPAAIKSDPAFDVREVIHDPTQIAAIMQGMRNGERPASPVVWQDPDDGRFCVVDGRQRIAAFLDLNEGQSVPVHKLECSRAQAMLEAAHRRSIGALVLTPFERTDAAWRLVRAPAQGNREWAFSKRDVAKAAGVSERTVANMRTRWKELRDAERVPSGSWQRDRRDHEGGGVEMSDSQRAAFIQEVTKSVFAALAPYRRKDDSALCEALEAAMGKALADHYREHILGEDEPFDGTWSGETYEEDDAAMAAF